MDERQQVCPRCFGKAEKDTPGMALEAADGRVRDDQMPRRVYQTFVGASQDPTGGSRLSEAFLRSLPKMRLTPEFLVFVMGYPIGWLNPLLYALVTRLSHKSSSPLRKPSGKKSKKNKDIEHATP